MEIIEKVIKISKPSILDRAERTFKDWGEYSQTYVNVLDKQLCSLFSDTFDYFCKKENKLVGRDSWLGHREGNIKMNKKQYEYEFWELENIEEFSFGFKSTRGNVIGKLVVNIEYV